MLLSHLRTDYPNTFNDLGLDEKKLSQEFQRAAANLNLTPDQVEEAYRDSLIWYGGYEGLFIQDIISKGLLNHSERLYIEEAFRHLLREEAFLILRSLVNFRAKGYFLGDAFIDFFCAFCPKDTAEFAIAFINTYLNASTQV